MRALRSLLVTVVCVGSLTGVAGAVAAPCPDMPTAAVNAQEPALGAKIAALAARTQQLEDLGQIKKLQRAYGYYLDKGYWQEAADLFAADATFESGVDGVYVGKRRIAELLVRQGGGNPGPGLPYGQLNHHMQLQPIVHVAPDGGTAKGRWREFALLGQYKKYAAWGDGIYENDYVKQNGVWKIARLHYFPNFVAPYKGGWASLKPVDGDWKSDVAREFPADLPPTIRYQPFPQRFTPPFHYANPVGVLAAVCTAPGRDDRDRLTTALGAAEQQLARLESREAIDAVQAAYGYYIDKGLWTRAAALFAGDATYEFGQQGVYVGRAHIRKALAQFGPEGLRTGQLNNYMMLQPIIDVAPDNRSAKARWRSDVELADAGKGYWSEGEYENEYVNEHGIWKIARLHFYVTMLGRYDAGWKDGPLPLDGPSQSLPPDRPPSEVYQSLPAVYLPPYHYKNPVSDGTPLPAPAHVELSADASGPLTRAAAAVDTLGTSLERLDDVAAIEKVQRAYGYYVDKAMWPEVSRLFADNGTLEIGGRGVFIGPKRVLDYLVTGLGPIGPQQGQVINHQQFQPIVDVSADGTTAWGRWTALVMGTGVWGDVTYENQYVKENGIWKLAKLHAPFNMYALYPEGWETSAIPETRPDSFLPPPDLPPTVVLLTYPSFYVEPYHYPNPVTGNPMPRQNPGAGGTAPMRPVTDPAKD